MGKEDIKRVREFARKIARHIKVDKVLLFGSRARGDNLKYSDFDVIVISKDFKKYHFLGEPCFYMMIGGIMRL